MFAITWRELKDKKWSLLAFSLGMMVMLWLYVATFRSSQASTQQLQQLLKSYPKAFIDAFGLGDLSVNSVEVYLNAKHFAVIWPLVAIILALARAASQIAGEIGSGTMGLLLASPLERRRIFVAKYAAGLLTIMIFTFASVFITIPIAAAYGIPSHLSILFPAWILTMLFMLAVYSFGLAVSAWVGERGTVYAIAGTAAVLTYAAYIVSLISQPLNWLKYLSSFYYFNTQLVLSTGRIEARSWAYFGGLIVISTAVAWWRFNQRDISV